MTTAGRKAADKAIAALEKQARAYPGSNDALSCNNVAFKTGRKSFLFLGVREDEIILRFKLNASLPEAQALAAKEPSQFEAGKGGWVKATLPRDEAPPKGLLSRWTEESFRLMATKKLLAEHDAPSA